MYSKPITPIHHPGLPYLLQFTVSCLGFEQQPPRLCLQQVRRIRQGNTVHFLQVTSTPFVVSLAPSDPLVPTLGEEQVCRHRGQPAQSKWLTGATKCNQVHISSTMIQRCNTGTARYGEYRQVQSNMENTGTVGDSHSPPRFPCLPPHCWSQLPKH